MSRNWSANVKKYVPQPDEAAINGIVRHLGMALQSRDGTFIACGDHNERERVRDNFLKHKLGVTGSDAELTHHSGRKDHGSVPAKDFAFGADDVDVDGCHTRDTRSE